MDAEHGGVEDTAALRKAFWRDTPEEGRRVLMPFFWNVIATRGQLYGNQGKGSVARVTNGFKFSYPGYNEMLTGAPDPRIDRNDYGPNPNVTVFEWLGAQPGFRGKVAAFGTWDAFGAIFNRDRSKLFVRAGWEAPFTPPSGSAQHLLNGLYATTTRYWSDLAWDSFLYYVAREYLSEKHPRVLFLGFGETDEWAHAGRYDKVLESAHQVDDYVRELWALMQSMPEYRGKTTFIVTADHGRGSGPSEWKDHDRKIAGAENIWIAVLGPDTPALGDRMAADTVTQSQIAATVAALLGEDYHAAVPASAPAIAGAFQPPR